MQIKQLLYTIRSQDGIKDDDLAPEILLAYLLNQDRAYLISHNHEELSQEQEEQFRSLFVRFLKGEPVAYIINNKEFYELDFYVDRRVLIPRPETELLVEKTLEVIKYLNREKSISQKNGVFYNNQRGIRILDVGTGSGCIAISLAKKINNISVTATDFSKEALEVAIFNATKHNVKEKINFLYSDLLENIYEPFDIIVANLPYIGKEKFNFVNHSTYTYEPHLALFGGNDGLFLYEKLFQQLSVIKWKPFTLLGEFGFLQREELEKIIRKYFEGNTLEIFPDYAKIDRVFSINFASHDRKT